MLCCYRQNIIATCTLLQFRIVVLYTLYLHTKQYEIMAISVWYTSVFMYNVRVFSRVRTQRPSGFLAW